MDIRKSNNYDYMGIIDLLETYGFPRLEEEELYSGSSFVAVEDEEIVGFIWALVSGRVAYVNYLVVDVEYRHKVNCGRSKTGIMLGVEMMKMLYSRGVTKLTCLVGKREYSDMLLRFYRDSLGMKEIPCSAAVTGDPKQVLENLEVRNV